MTVSTAWEGRAVRASDVPAGGLDSARLRFELLSPGNLWIDDLHIPNETTSRSGLLNARRTLLEAIQAYREELRRIRPAGRARTGYESRVRPRPPGWQRDRPRTTDRRIRTARQRRAFCPFAGPEAQVESASE